MQQPLSFMVPECSWAPTPVSQLPSWQAAPRISIDLETRDPQLRTLGIGVRRGGKVCGYGFKLEDGPEHYLPVAHEGGDNLPQEHVVQYMRDQASEFRGWVVGANLAYDLDYLWENGIYFPKAKGYVDIQINEPLIDDLQQSYSVENIAARYGLPGKDKLLLKDALQGYGLKNYEEMYKLPGRFAAAVCLQDVRLPLIIARRQERVIEDKDLGEIHQLESKLIPVLVRMRRRGVRVDFDRLNYVEQWTKDEQQKCLDLVQDKTGITMGMDDVRAPKALANVLISIGVDKNDIPITPKTKVPSIDNLMLKKLKHPIADALLRARKMDKVRGTFVESIRKHAVRGRIHCTFNQLRITSEDEDSEGARYGRISCVDPNMQQQPGKDPELGPLWRSIYVPDEGKIWCAADYSQQEPRMTVHFAEVCGCKRAWEAAERYRTDPNCDNHTLTAQLIAGQGPDWKPTKELRSHAKIIFLGLAYGMGGAKLAKDLGLPTEFKYIERIKKTIEVAGPEAQALFDQFHRGVPFVRELSYLCQDAVRSKGYIRTLLGRHCHFPEKPPEMRQDARDTYDWLHKALNRLVQGSAGDQTKLATLKVDEAGHNLQLQVHDELDLSVQDEKEAASVGDIMSNCVKLKVPSKVDVELGTSWGDSM